MQGDQSRVLIPPGIRKFLSIVTLKALISEMGNSIIRRSYAVHEAGHAVVARRLGRMVHRVWIDPDHQKGGTDTVPEDLSSLSVQDRLALYTICAAGQVATNKLNVEAPTELAQGDREYILNLISRMSAEEQTRLRNDAFDCAAKIVSENEEMLKALATELERNSVLDRATFEAIAAKFER